MCLAHPDSQAPLRRRQLRLLGGLHEALQKRPECMGMQLERVSKALAIDMSLGEAQHFPSRKLLGRCGDGAAWARLRVDGAPNLVLLVLRGFQTERS
jgi:hypothetical protein